MISKALRFVPAAALLVALGEAGTFPNEVVTTSIASSTDNDVSNGLQYQVWYHPYGTVSGVAGPVHEYCNACGNAQAGYKLRIYSKQDPTKEKFDKPIIIAPGFDPDQGSTSQFKFDDFRDMLSYTYNEVSPYNRLPDQNLLKELYEDNYDIVLVLFYNSNIDIPTQALNLEQAYLWVKSVSSTDNLTEPAIIGPSMGGLVTRYMLQTAGSQPNAGGVNSRLFIAWDAPNRGAEIPMSLQNAVKYLKGYNSDAEVLDRNITSVAAGQMLLSQTHDRPDESETHIITDYEVAATPHGDFMWSLNTDIHRNMLQNIRSTDGFTPIRTVAISNGSNQGSNGQRGIPPSYEYYYVSSAPLDWSMRTSASNFEQEVFFGDTPDQYQWHYHFQEPAFVENMPGGNRSSYNQFRNVVNRALSDILNTSVDVGLDGRLQSGHCFIPTVSALGYLGNPNSNNFWLATSGTSIFDETHVPTENQEHVRITGQNKAWIMDALKAYGPRPNPIVPVIRPMLF